MLKHEWIYTLLPKVKYTETKKGTVTYIDLSCGFDIETTSTYTPEGEKVAFMYIWMLGLGHNSPVYYGRTWEEFAETLNHITEYFGLGEDRILPIYVHNLSFEFQFMRKYFNWVDMFASAERKPLKATTNGGIEFRDSLILSGYSLEGTAKNLVKYKVTKATGDLDYTLPRHAGTHLSEKEMGYCKRDIEVITAYIEEQREIYGSVVKIPMTNTGRVREFTKAKCFGNAKEAGIEKGDNLKSKRKGRSCGNFVKYRKIMSKMTLTPDVYSVCSNAFAGGFTHASPIHCGKTLENVSSYDFTSSYPAVMVTEKFPMGTFEPCVFESIDQLNRVCDENKCAVLFTARFHNLKAKITQDLYLSTSKAFELSGEMEFNGRVAHAEVYATHLIDTDWRIIRECYTWDRVELSNTYITDKNYLPRPILEACAELYIKKTVLKGVEGSEAEYMVSKGMLNSLYGMCVTSIIQDEAIYEHDTWEVQPSDMLEAIDTYNNKKMRFLYYPWGVWITGYARLNLWSGILAIGDDYVYSDTDSIKLLNHEKHAEYFKNYDAEVLRKIDAMYKETKYAIDREAFSPKTIKGEVKPIGVWDYEGTYDKFKTLGAKRYLTLKGDKLEMTVAGVGKKDGAAYLEFIGNGDYDSIFNTHFTDKLHFPQGSINKLTHIYIDDRMDVLVEDYLGNSQYVHPESGVHLSKADFTLSMAEKTKHFLEALSKGEVLN